MNWKRIWIGGLVAGAVLFALDAVLYGATGAFRIPEAFLSFLVENILFSVATGTILCGLYALARPRLGPGPKTALVMGSIAFALLYGGVVLNPKIWMVSPLLLLGQALFSWVKCLAATYVAGWQYIEKAPS